MLKLTLQLELSQIQEPLTLDEMLIVQDLLLELEPETFVSAPAHDSVIFNSGCSHTPRRSGCP